MDAVAVDVIVLNYNGGSLPAECLPTILRAAGASHHCCRVVVIDNGSTDGSDKFIAEQFPNVELHRLPNRGLCSFNTFLRESTSRVALLLNNDVKSADDAFDPLIGPFLTADPEPIAFTSPRCRLFDGVTHEGLKTAVSWRYGLVQATSLFDGAEAAAGYCDSTASAGAVLAVDRASFVALGGFDASYLPGRIEDLDFCYRAFQAGYQGRYVPESNFLHRGGATFHVAFGLRGCDHLALRNTLVFQWRHLRHPLHLARQLFWLPIRVLRDVVRAPWVVADKRFAFCRAVRAAWFVQRSNDADLSAHRSLAREREFFARHAPRRLAAAGEQAWREGEAARDVNYPLSRWYLRPTACAVARRLVTWGVRPLHVTFAGFLCAVLAAACLFLWPQDAWITAGLILASWFCDRTDGPLARLQRSSGPLGAWIDANVDEFVDLGLHTATAAAASSLTASPQPWLWLIAFLFGKYLLMHGLASDDDLTATTEKSTPAAFDQSRGGGWIRTLYHLPANADVRAHLLIIAVAGGWLTIELAFIAVYYNFRWLARYALLARRFRAATASGATT